MLIVEMFRWWYVRGWKMFLGGLKDQLKNAIDFFSIRLLVRNMFAPFRQISAGKTSSPALEARIAAFFDRLLSRFVGAMTRTFLLIIGTIFILFQAVAGVAIMILWPMAPALVVVCLILTIAQVSF